ncbi:MAG: hypothetical protein KIT89_09860 [Microcella sp.]|uniref:hypothetical protein n=1 Tax=Microcella sp. TaxID=1913979 RepID=UPI0024CC8979|nr:hypothetical protein [Microcella sp.]UYN83007.1 MAG: hypothetical protein KIT89_09860 [Microcella sp.]
MSTRRALSTTTARSLVCVSAVGAAIIHAALAVSATTGGVAAVLALAAAAELSIAMGVAAGVRWLTASRVIAGLIVPPVAWAALLLIAVTAKVPEATSALVMLPLVGAAFLALAGVAFAGVDARRTRVGARVRTARPVAVVAAATLFAALVVTPSVVATLPARADDPIIAERPAAPVTQVVFGDHADH